MLRMPATGVWANACQRMNTASTRNPPHEPLHFKVFHRPIYLSATDRAHRRCPIVPRFDGMLNTVKLTLDCTIGSEVQQRALLR